MILTYLTKEHDLKAIVKEINSATWDEANEISRHEVHALESYLDRQDTLLLTCHAAASDSPSYSKRTLLGFASARIQIKPYGEIKWLYIDEVDVCVDQRKKGAGKAIMKELIAFAEKAGCEEVWLGTEIDNVPANALYKSLKPDDIEPFVGYTFELDDN